MGKTVGGGEILFIGCIGIADYTSNTIVIHPRLGGSLLTHNEARILADELIRRIGRAKDTDVPSTIEKKETERERRKSLRKERREKRKNKDVKDKQKPNVHGDGGGSSKKGDVLKRKRRRRTRVSKSSD